MPTDLMESWRTERDTILAAMENIVTSEERTEANTRSLAEYEARLGLLGQQMEDHTRLIEARSSAHTLDTRAALAGVGGARPTDEPAPGSMADEFLESEQFRSWHFHGTSSAVELETRAPILTTTPGWEGLFKPAQTTIAEPSVPLPLYGVVTVEPVSGGSVEWVQVALEPNAAAIVAEGAVKPESGLKPTLESASLDTWAHWVQTSRQALEDSARLRTIIDTQLRDGIAKKVHDSIAAELAAADLPAYAGPGDLLTAIRGGMAVVQGNGFAPNAVLLNPMDWADLDIAVMVESVDGPVRKQSFWGLTIVAVPGQPAGTATVGDFKAGVKHFRRNAIGVYVTDSHAETFISNIFTILAEQRAKTAVVNPNALVEVTAAPAGGATRSGNGGSAKKSE